MNATQSDVRTGMHVRSADGHDLGKVIEVTVQGFVVEKGFFFPREYTVLYEYVQDVDADDESIVLRQGRDDLSTLGGLNTEDAARSTRAGDDTGLRGSSTDADRRLTDQDSISVPVKEEQLEATKTDRDAGEVRVHKHVVTEQKTIAVPVRREVADVERVSVADRPAGPGEAEFRDETVSVPLREEEVQVSKRPVVRGEVRVSKSAVTEQEQVSDQVRREEVDVEPEGDVRRSDRGAPGSDDRRGPLSGRGDQDT